MAEGSSAEESSNVLFRITTQVLDVLFKMEGEQPRAMGALLALAYHYAGRDVPNRLMEGLMATSVWQQVFAERLEQRFAQGREEGRAEEARALLRRYLEQRFGTIPPALEERIAASDAATLAALFDRALLAMTIEALDQQ